MRFWAVFKTTAEKHIPIDADNWQEAAKLANEMGPQKITETAYLSVLGMVADDDLDEEYISHYDSAHELIGPCNKCGRMTFERPCTDACRDTHGPDRGGWVCTEHGHVTWCSQECRDADKANDPEVEVLDRMAGI